MLTKSVVFTNLLQKTNNERNEDHAVDSWVQLLKWDKWARLGASRNPSRQLKATKWETSSKPKSVALGAGLKAERLMIRIHWMSSANAVSVRLPGIHANWQHLWYIWVTFHDVSTSFFCSHVQGVCVMV